MSNNEIYHFGIKGMKWGRRRYQNRDGTLTEEGKKRYSEESESQKSTTDSKDSGTSSKKRSVSELSDAELRTRINRMQLEKQYKQLLNDGVDNNTKQVKSGKSFVNEVGSRAVRSVIVPAVEDIGRQVVRFYLADFTNKIFKFKGDKMVFANNKKK